MVCHASGGLTVSTLASHAPQLWLGEDLDGVLVREFAGGTVAFTTRRDPHKQTPNEDALAIIPVSDTAGVLAVADGCGGQANGLLASQLAVEALCVTLANADSGTNLRAPILDGFESAFSHVRQLGTGAATTLTAVEINAGIIRTFHAGDSQALVVGSRGKVKLQTQSHSPVGYAVEAGMLTEHAALYHEDRHLVSNVIGADGSHIDMGLPRKLDKQDTLILGSDGLFDNLRQDEIVQLIRKGPLIDAAATVAAKVTQRMTAPTAGAPCKPDDLTLIMYRQGVVTRSLP